MMAPRPDIRVAVVAGIRTSCGGRRAMVDAVCGSDAEGGRPPRLLFDVNGQAIALYWKDRAYRGALDAADLVHADGQPVVFASRLFCEHTIQERSATTDLLLDVAARAAREGLSFYLLGGEEAINARAADELRTRYPALRIAGRRHGFFRADEEDAVIEDINAAAPDILWLGLGKPKEQVFAARIRDRLACRWIITCGGCFNFLTGAYPRAPLWMQKAGLEWLHRLLAAPRKLFWRYLTTNPVAVYRILRCSR